MLVLSSKVERLGVFFQITNDSVCFDCKGPASVSKSSVHDTTSVSFRQLDFLWCWISGHGLVELSFNLIATSNLQNG